MATPEIDLVNLTLEQAEKAHKQIADAVTSAGMRWVRLYLQSLLEEERTVLEHLEGIENVIRAQSNIGAIRDLLSVLDHDVDKNKLMQFIQRQLVARETLQQQAP